MIVNEDSVAYKTVTVKHAVYVKKYPAKSLIREHLP